MGFAMFHPAQLFKAFQVCCYTYTLRNCQVKRKFFFAFVRNAESTLLKKGFLQFAPHSIKGQEAKNSCFLSTENKCTELPTHISGNWGRFTVWKNRLKRVILQQPNTSTTADPGTRRMWLKVFLSQKSSQLAMKTNKIQKNFFSAATSIRKKHNPKPTNSGKHPNPEVLYCCMKGQNMSF